MAKYKKGHKKQKGDKFLTYVLIGFAVTFVAVLASLILFNAFDNTIDYNSFDTVDDYSQVASQDEDRYLVYWYTERCPACINIKQEVLDFADSNVEGIKVYFMDASKTSGVNIINYHTQLTGTPSMLTVVNGVIVDLNSGSDTIPAIFDDINDGTYSVDN